MLRTTLTAFLAAALRTTGLVARVVGRACANTLSSGCRRRRPLGRLACRLPRRRSRRIGWLDVKGITRVSLIGCSLCNISCSGVVCIHAIEALVILAAQGVFFVEAVAGGLLTIVVEPDKLLGIGTFGAGTSFGFSSAIAFDAKGAAASTLGRDRGVDSSDGAPFVLLSLVIDTDGVVLHTAEDVIVPFIVDPGNRVGEALLQGGLAMLDEFKDICVSKGSCFSVGR